MKIEIEIPDEVIEKFAQSMNMTVEQCAQFIKIATEKLFQNIPQLVMLHKSLGTFNLETAQDSLIKEAKDEVLGKR